MNLKFIFIIFCVLVFCSNVHAQSAFDSDFFDDSWSYDTPGKRKNSVFINVGQRLQGPNLASGASLGYGRSRVFFSTHDKWNDFFSVAAEILFVESDTGTILFVYGLPLRYGLEFNFKFCKWCVFGVNSFLQAMVAVDMSNWYIAGGLEGFIKVTYLHPLDFILGGELGMLVPGPDPIAGFKLGALLYF